jgi:hypothetical protein
MDELFDEMDKLLEVFINTPSNTPSKYNTPSNNTTVVVSPAVQQVQVPSSISSPCQNTPIRTKLYCRKDVILLSSKKEKNGTQKKGAKVSTKSNANIQNLVSDVNSSDTECGQEMKLSDFFKPGPFKRKRKTSQDNQNTPKKKCRIGMCA